MGTASDLLSAGAVVGKFVAAKAADKAIGDGLNKLNSKIDSAIMRGMDKLGLGDDSNAEIVKKGLARAGSTLARAMSRPDPLMVWQFEVDMPTVGGESTGMYLLPDIYIENFQLSPGSVESESYIRRASNQYMATTEDTPPITIQVYEDSRMLATAYFNAWRHMIRDCNTGLYNYVNNYKRKIVLRVVGVDKDKSCIAEFHIIGAFVTNSNSNGYAFGSEAAERILVTAELSVDDVLFFPKIDTAIAPAGSIKNGLGALPQGSFDLKSQLLKVSGLDKLAQNAAGAVQSGAKNVVSAAAGSVSAGVTKVTGFSAGATQQDAINAFLGG